MNSKIDSFRKKLLYFFLCESPVGFYIDIDRARGAHSSGQLMTGAA